MYLYYTIPSDNRELQPLPRPKSERDNYTIPSDNRELQQWKRTRHSRNYYTIPSDNRELQQCVKYKRNLKIIPYQVITGNYNIWKTSEKK